jgi:DNA-binding response OmpR family regulator
MDETHLKRILIVEDDESLRSLYLTILKDAGFDVDLAPDGTVGLEKMSAGGYDLVLLDIMLPGMDGLAILDKLYNNPPVLANKHIVVISNVGQDETIAKAMGLGAQGYLIKSDYTPDQIVEQVNSFLNLTPVSEI